MLIFFSRTLPLCARGAAAARAFNQVHEGPEKNFELGTQPAIDAIEERAAAPPDGSKADVSPETESQDLERFLNIGGRSERHWRETGTSRAFVRDLKSSHNNRAILTNSSANRFSRGRDLHHLCGSNSRLWLDPLESAVRRHLRAVVQLPGRHRLDTVSRGPTLRGCCRTIFSGRSDQHVGSDLSIGTGVP